MTAAPSFSPFELHGMPQHSDAISSGTVTRTPARRHSVRKASVAEVSAPNIAPVQLGRKTTSAAVSGSGRRGAPPAGRSADHCGTTSSPNKLRPSLDIVATVLGAACAADRARVATLVAPAQCRAAERPPAWARRPCSEARRRRTSEPVSIPTGQAV